MKSFIYRNGKLSPIKVFLTLTWIMFQLFFALMLIAVAKSVLLNHPVPIDFIQVLINGTIGLIVQLTATQILDTWRQNKKDIIGGKE